METVKCYARDQIMYKEKNGIKKIWIIRPNALIITYPSGHMCLSTWTGAVVSNSLVTASRRGSKFGH